MTSAEDLAESIGEVGAVAKQVGISLNDLNGYTTALVSSTGISGSEAGTALKSMISRTFRIGSDGAEDAGKTEKLLGQMGVAVRDDVTQSFRDFNDILQDVSKGWSNYSNVERMAIAQSIGGTQHFSKFTSLMENLNMATEASGVALNSENSALIENSKALDSLSGKWSLLKAGMNNTKLSLFQDDALKNLIDVGIAVTDITQKLGGFNVAMAAMITFGSKKIALFDFMKDVKTWDSFKIMFKGITGEVVNFGKKLLTPISSLKNLKNSFNGTSTAAKGAATSSTVASTAFKGTGIAAGLAATGVQLLKAALTFGIGLAISFVVEKLISLISHLANAKNELKEFNNQATEVSQNDTSTILKASNLKKQIEEEESKLNNSGFTGDKAEVQSKLNEMYKEMATLLPQTVTGYNEEGEAISKNTSLIQEEIEVMKTKRLEDAKTFVAKNKTVKDTLKLLEEERNTNKAIKDTMDNGGSKYKKNVKQVQLTGYGNSNESKTTMVEKEFKANNKTLQESESKLIEYQTVIAQTMQQIQSLRAVGISDKEISEIFGINPDEIEKQSQAVKSYSETVDDIRKKALEAANQVDESPATAGKSFSAAVEEAQKLRDIVNDINEAQRMTPETIKDITESYPDLIGKVHDTKAMQEALNEKIKDQVTVQQEAYQTMIGDDNAWYASRLQNGNEMQNAFNQFASNFMDINSEAYNFDATQYGNLNEAKVGMINQLAGPMAEFLSKYVGGSAESYQKDLNNFRTLGQAKAYVLAQLNSKMQQLQANYESIMDSANDAIQKMNNLSAENARKYSASNPDSLRLESRTLSKLSYVKKNISEISTAISSANAAFEGFNTNLGVGMPSFASPVNGSGGSGKSPATQAEKDAQDERVKMEEEANRQIQDLRDKLVSALKKKYEDLRKKELEPLDKEIEMKQKELDRLRNGGKDEKERLAALKEELRLWEKNDSSYSKEKVNELKKQVKEAELNLDIKELEDKKESINKKYDDLLTEEKIYAEASKLIQQNKYDEMKDLLTKYGEDFKEISVLLGQSIADIIKGQLDATKAAYDFLKGTTNTYNGNTTTSSGGSGSSSGGSVSTGSKVKVTDSNAPIYYTSTSGGNSGTWKGAGVGTSEGLYVVNTNNGRAALSRTNSINGAIGWIEMSKVAKFKVGGDVGNWNNTDGKLAYVHSGERVLTQEQNKMFSDLIYKLLPQLAILEKSNIFNTKNYNNETTNSSIIHFNNNYNVTNKTQFDLAKFKLDIEQIIKNSLAKAGIRTAF